MDPKENTTVTHERLDARDRSVRPGVHTVATTEHERIRAWAARHNAEPATGQATTSGPAVLDVLDMGAGIRFNFPGFARLRPISWEEWFENFDRYGLLFVYEEEDTDQVAQKAYAKWARRGEDAGHDREDWFEAERDLQRQAGGDAPSARYRIVKNVDL